MAEKLEIIVDGIIYQRQSRGGISRVFSEILPRMCGMDNLLDITILTQGQLKQTLPEHPRIRHRSIFDPERYLRPRQLWLPVMPAVKQFVRRLYVGRGQGKIWHSTFYTMPENWDGNSVVTVHDMIFERFCDFYNGQSADRFRERKRRCIQDANAVICVSETTREDVQNFYGLDFGSIYVIPHACSDAFRQLEQGVDGLAASTKQPFLLYVGIRAPYKNFDMLIRAYSRWHQRKDVALVLVGERPWSTDEQQCLAQLQIQHKVQLLADVDDETLCYLYNQAVALVYPSLYEGFGIPLLEAMACGCPIIASRIPSTIEVVGDCPIYFNPTEVDDLVNALNILLAEGRNPERIEAGIRKAGSYSWDKTATQTLEVYRAVRT